MIKLGQETFRPVESNLTKLFNPGSDIEDRIKVLPDIIEFLFENIMELNQQEEVLRWMISEIKKDQYGYIEKESDGASFSIDYYPPDDSYLTLMFIDDDKLFINSTHGMTTNSVRITFSENQLFVEKII